MRGSLHNNLRRFLNVTGPVRLILAAKLIAGGLHEFLDVGILSVSPSLDEMVEILPPRRPRSSTWAFRFGACHLCAARTHLTMAPPLTFYPVTLPRPLVVMPVA